MRYALLVLVFSASTASAQTVEATLDVASLGWGPLSLPQSIETDGDLSTTEWLLRRPFTNEMRVVTERDGVVCAGPWFSPAAGLSPWLLQRRGLTHIIVTQEGGSVKIIRIDTPACDH